MKVMHVTPVYMPAWEFGGTVRAIHGMTTALVAAGHDVEVVTTAIGTPYAGSPKSNATTVDGVKVTYVPGWLRWGGAVAPRLPGEVLGRVSQDSSVHISSGWQPAFRALFAGLRRRGQPYVYSPHGCFSPEVLAKGRVKKAAYYALFERSHLRSAAVVLATSKMEAADLHRLDSAFCVKVVPNVCDAGVWFPAKAEGLAWRRRHAIADDAVVVLQVCRPDAIKNTDLLIEALRAISPGKSYVLAVLGPGQSRVPLEKPLPSHVRMIRDDGSSKISELRAAYSAAQVVAVPSLYECFGNVVLEAILCGTPVLAGPRVGAAFLSDSAAAVTIIPLRVDAWTHAIFALPKYAKVSEDIIINAASAVASSRIANQLSEIYASI